MKKTIVYWSTMPGEDFDWSILYQEPQNLFSKQYSARNKKDRMGKQHHHNMFMCPAVSKFMKETFVLSWPIETSLEIDKNQKKIYYSSQNYVNANVDRIQSIENSIPLSFSLSYIFFSEDPIEMTVTAPYSNFAPHLQYGSIIPGRFMIDSWFRPVIVEFNLWDGVNQFIIKEDEPFAYVSFKNLKEDCQIELQRFAMNNELQRISMTCSNTPMWGWGESLSKKYLRFRKTKINNIVMKNIRDNLT